jgi:hypothetical protein
VASDVGVEFPKGGDGAPAPGQVGKVEVGCGYRAWAEIKRAGGEYAAWKVLADGRLPLVEERDLRLVEGEQKRHPHGKEDWKKTIRI